MHGYIPAKPSTINTLIKYGRMKEETKKKPNRLYAAVCVRVVVFNEVFFSQNVKIARKRRYTPEATFPSLFFLSI